MDDEDIPRQAAEALRKAGARNIRLESTYKGGGYDAVTFDRPASASVQIAVLKIMVDWRADENEYDGPRWRLWWD